MSLAQPTDQPLRPETAQRAKRVLIHAFVAFHLCAVLAWCLTSSTSQLPLHKKVRKHLAPYMGWSGLWQGWTMFAPNAPMVNSYLEAEVTLDDGTTAVYAFPRMDQLGYAERYQKERYRKWVHERVMRGGSPDPAMCAAAARLAARRVAEVGGAGTEGAGDSGAEAEVAGARVAGRGGAGARGGRRSVRLVRYWAEIPRPGTAGGNAEWKRQVIYEGEVDAARGVVTTAGGAGGAAGTREGGGGAREDADVAAEGAQ